MFLCTHFRTLWQKIITTPEQECLLISLKNISEIAMSWTLGIMPKSFPHSNTWIYVVLFTVSINKADYLDSMALDAYFWGSWELSMTRQLLHIVPMPTQYFTQERVVSYFVTMTTKIINVTNSIILVSLTLSFYSVPEDDDLFFGVNQDTLNDENISSLIGSLRLFFLSR